MFPEEYKDKQFLYGAYVDLFGKVQIETFKIKAVGKLITIDSTKVAGGKSIDYHTRLSAFDFQRYAIGSSKKEALEKALSLKRNEILKICQHLDRLEQEKERFQEALSLGE